MENSNRSFNAHEMSVVMENITHKMAQIKQMFPNYHAALGDTYRKIQTASMQ